MSTATARRPVLYDLPTEKATEARETLVSRIRQGFVLDGSHLEPKVKYALSPNSEDVTVLEGEALEMVEVILRVYPKAGSNRKTSALQRAINLTRTYFTKTEHFDLNTRTKSGDPIEDPTDQARAFALAMKFCHEALAWATAE